jgi:glutamine amidotransferase
MVGLIDYGMGNLLSVFNALEMIGADVEICTSPADMLDKEHLVLPGVGSFGDCMNNLHKRGFSQILNKLVIDDQRPILGICLGMQVMASRGFEGGECKGLGWIDAEVIKISNCDSKVRVPHIGWNSLDVNEYDLLFKELPEKPDVYFVHSYFMNCNNDKDVVATCEYGRKITAAVHQDNIFGVQFHPEKSQEYGLKVFENFLEYSN